MTKPISDKAEVTLEYPDKFYSGTFERSSRFEVSFDASGLLLILEHPGSEDVRKSIHLHIHYGLLADILQQAGLLTPNIPKNEMNLERLLRAVSVLQQGLQTAGATEAAK